MPTLLYQQVNVEIYWDEKEKWLYVNWTAPQSSAEFQRDCEQMLRLMVARNTDSILNDHSKVDGAWLGAAEWGAKDWFPRMRQAGLRYFAMAYPPDRFGQISTADILGTAAPGTAKLFASVQEAGNWLRIQRRRDAARTQRIVLPPGLGAR